MKMYITALPQLLLMWRSERTIDLIHDFGLWEKTKRKKQKQKENNKL